MRSLRLTPTSTDALSGRGERTRMTELPLSDIVRSTANDLVTLVTAEVKLAKLEVTSSVRHALDRAGWVVAGVTALVVGYLVGVAALAAWLSTFWGWPGALAVTALSQAILGGAVLWVAPSGTTEAPHDSSSGGSHG